VDSGVEDNNSDAEENSEAKKMEARRQLDGDDDDDTAGNDDGSNREIEDALLQNKFIRGYKYDKKHSTWCELTFEFPTKMRKVDLTPVLRDVAAKSVIYEIPHIRRAITYKQNDETILKTDGINIVEMFKYNQILDIHRLYSNDIHGIAKTYGIEAAARVIVKEVQNVFKVYGIVVDPRHLLLIADYMTFDGTFKSLSRNGMGSSASPLQQMSFETSLKFMCEATVMAKEENLCNPSGRLMVGQPSNMGTGAFKLISDNSYFFKKLMEAN
jgi:DNA-directed RNA polymerase I subunit RPA1